MPTGSAASISGGVPTRKGKAHVNRQGCHNNYNMLISGARNVVILLTSLLCKISEIVIFAEKSLHTVSRDRPSALPIYDGKVSSHRNTRIYEMLRTELACGVRFYMKEM